MGLDLVCVGETFEDLIFHDLSEWPRLGEEFRTQRLLRTWGGGALLTAVAASRQGSRVGVVSGLASAAQRFLRGEGILVRNLRRSHEAHAVTVALSTREDRAFVTYPGVNEQLEERFLSSLSGVRARHVHLALEPRDCLAWVDALQRLRKRGITTSWDFGWHAELVHRPGFSQLTSSLDTLFLNEAEALLYAGSAPWESWWKKHVGCTIVKLGKQGCLALTGSDRLAVAGLAVMAVDSTGAGDAFNGGFLAAMLEGRDLQGALELGNQLGAASTLCAGGLEGLPRR